MCPLSNRVSTIFPTFAIVEDTIGGLLVVIWGGGGGGRGAAMPLVIIKVGV